MTTLRTLSEASVTQSTEAVESLLNYLGKSTNCRHMKTLSKDAEAVPDEKARKITMAKAACEENRRQAQEHQARLRESKEMTTHLDPVDTVRPSGKWPGGFNGPVDLESIKAKTEPNKAGA